MRKSLESQFFNVSFVYSVDLVDKLILLHHEAVSEKRTQSLKWLIFKMMKDVVKKNSLNFLNLMRAVPKSARSDDPTMDDLIFDCCSVFDNCLKNYEIGSNFYFYFNTALSRYFFRKFQKEETRANLIADVEDDNILNNMSEYSNNGGVERVELVIDLLQFTDVEKKICLSRCNGQRTEDFLKENKNISSAAYTKAMKVIKQKLSEIAKEEQYE